MPVKPGSKNRDDIKMLMAALAVTTTLGLWNLFASLDKPATTQDTVSLQSIPPAEAENATQQTFRGRILLGGQAPSQQVIVVRRPNNSRNAQQPSPVTQTRSS